MIIIGIDFGDARMGLAVSDAGGVLAGDVGTVEVRGLEDAAEKAAAKIKELGASLAVIGLPLNMDGTEGYRSARTRRFAALLEELSGVGTVLTDERLSTVEAHIYMNMNNVSGTKRKKKVDTVSARIILQSYLDSKNTRRGL